MTHRCVLHWCEPEFWVSHFRTCVPALLPPNELSECENAGSPSGRRRRGRTCRGEVSLRCASPCESAAPPSGWKLCRSVSICTVSHLKESQRFRSGHRMLGKRSYLHRNDFRIKGGNTSWITLFLLKAHRPKASVEAMCSRSRSGDL